MEGGLTGPPSPAALRPPHRTRSEPVTPLVHQLYSVACGTRSTGPISQIHTALTGAPELRVGGSGRLLGPGEGGGSPCARSGVAPTRCQGHLPRTFPELVQDPELEREAAQLQSRGGQNPRQAGRRGRRNLAAPPGALPSAGRLPRRLLSQEPSLYGGPSSLRPAAILRSQLPEHCTQRPGRGARGLTDAEGARHEAALPPGTTGRSPHGRVAPLCSVARG